MSFTEIDYHVFQAINQLGNNYSVLNPLMKILASKAEYVFYVGVVVYWFTRQEKHRRMVAQSLFSATIALAISGILGHFFYRDRPFVTHAVLQLIPHSANASFPSDHATAAFVIATSIWIFSRRSGYIWFLLAASIAFSRIWTGVHYPSDIISGAVIGVLTALLVNQFFLRSEKALKFLKVLIHGYEIVESKVWRKKIRA
ncbi:undecaprenyl-diphosphatase [Paenibacillus ferrarius]|uniref:undecaprenyl-diphosphatase n=1 Tax=Paenibacillus ferrarius TaxID=1469647 RepID=UPI003D2C9FB8